MNPEGFAPPAALAPGAFGWPPGAAAPSAAPNLPRRFATAEYVGGRGGLPPVYEARVLAGVEVGQSVSDAAGVGGRVSLTVADLRLDNADGALDSTARFGLAVGKPIALRAVPVREQAASDFGTPLGTAETLFRGEVAAVSALGAEARIALSDKTERLNQRLQAVRYAGEGGLEGRAELRNLPKPISLGERFNVTPVYLGLVELGDGSLPTYQTHWREIAGHDAVRERGTLAAKADRKPGVGEWRDWPLFGCFQLGFTPDGDITCDVRGDAPAQSYANTAGGVLRRVLSAPGPALKAEDMDAGAWDAFENAVPGVAGWGIGAEDATALQAAEQVLAAAGAWLAGTRSGLLAPAVVGAPAAVPHFDLEDADLLAHSFDPMPASLSPTPAAVEIGYRRNWSPSGNLRDAVAGGERDALSSPQQVARAFSSVIASRGLPPRTLSFPSLLRDQADARRRADEVLAWLERGLRLRTFTTDRYRNRITLGLTGEYAGGRYGPPWSGVVVGWRERVPACRVEIQMIG